MSNIITVTISGNTVQIIEATLQIKSRVDDKSSCLFTVKDDTGTLVFSQRQPVRVTDSQLGLLFSGFVNKPTCTNLYPNPTNLWSIDCVNKFVVPAKKPTNSSKTKRHRGGKHTKQHAGTIAANQIQEYVEPDGITGNFGLDWSELQTDWQTGTQSGVAATTNTSTGNVGAGDLELAATGSQVVASAGGAGFTLVNGLKLTGYASSGYSAAYAYRQIWTGSIVIATNDSLTFDLWISSDSPSIAASVSVTCSDGTTLTGSANTDNQGMPMKISTDLSGLANDTWYSRQTFFTGSFVGKTITSIEVALGGSNAGTYTAYFRRIMYNSTTIFGDASTLITNNQTLNIGYTNMSLTQVSVEDKSHVSVRGPLSIDAAKIIQSSQLSYTSLIPDGCTGLAETSIDNQASWQAHTSGNAIPNLLPGMSVAGRSVYVRFTFSVGKDPTVAIGYGAPTLTVNSAYNTSKSDNITTYTTANDFNTGVLTHLKTVGSTTTPAITIDGFQWNWANGFPSQTAYGSGSTSLVNKQQLLTANALSDLRLRMDFAGQWQDFIAEIDITVPANATSNTGLVYRTGSGNWQNNNDTYAYNAYVTQTSINLAHGTNSSSGIGAFTLITTFALSLASGSVHRLRVAVSGTTHQVSLDGVLLINTTDATYTAAGYLGLRVYNSSVSAITEPFNNFGVCSALSGTWQSPSINIAGPGTYGGSLIEWDTDGLPDSTTSITVQSSVDGGSTFQSVQNGGTVPNLTAGQSLTGKTLILLVTLAANNAPVVPVLNGVTAWILGQYSSSGQRSTAPLAWDNMIRGNSSGNFGTATNGASYTQTGTGTPALTSNEATISNTTGDVHMQIGTVTSGDTDGTVRFALSASTISAGMELRYSNAHSFYRLQASTTTISIIKAGGPTVTLATVAMALTISAYYQMRFRVVGSGINSSVNLYGKVWLDGTTEPVNWSLTGIDT